MAIGLYEGLVIIGIGLLGLFGSIQLDQQLSTMSIGVVMGPAKYIGVISLILIICGMIPVSGHLLKRRSGYPPAAPRLASARGGILVVVLLAWVAAVPKLGFTIGGLGFFPLLFYVSGLRPWFKSLVVGVITAALFYVVFVVGAKMPVPKGTMGL